MRDDLIHLKHAHVNQHVKEGEKTPWRVEANVSNKRLFSLPKELTDAQVFVIMDFARKFEQIAFEAGITFQKEVSGKMYDGQILQLQEMNKRATEENERLASKLQDLIGAKE